jgi:hypothetical protein
MAVEPRNGTPRRICTRSSTDADAVRFPERANRVT